MEEKYKAEWDNRKIWLILGILSVGISALLYLLLGENAVFTYHDQLDGEVNNYIYQAKYFWQGSHIPEFMNGAPKSAMTAPAPLFIFIYKIFSPFTAFLICQYLVMLLGFTGMYLLLKKMTHSSFVAVVASVLFAYLPLLNVYGLGMFGIPLLIWTFWKLYENPSWKQSLFYCALVILFGTLSSMVLIGYALIGILVILMIGMFLKKRREWKFLTGALCLLTTYLLSNIDLFFQLFGIGDTLVSHKTEMAISSTPFFKTIWQTFVYGVEHAASHQIWIIFLCIFIFLLGAWKKEIRSKQEFRWMSWLFLINIGIAILVALWNSGVIVNLRQLIGGPAVYVQLDRIYWIYPATWYMILGLCIKILYDYKKIFMIPAGGVVLITLVTILLSGNWSVNIKNLLKQDCQGISWQDFYAEDVFEMVGNYLEETYPELSRQDYRVASLGIAPAAALYNGFYCLDGYSNNYPLTYKEQFRQIIAPELEKSDYLREYYDDWGNRCYLLSSEIPGYYTVEKGGFYFTDFEMNTEAFKEMGGRFIFSAAYIGNADEIGLYMLGDSAFETDTSYYRIYIYQAK